jgi:hypothetical protein
VTGFLTAHVYLSKYKVGDARLHKRLVERGLKLLILFTLLNLVIALAFNWKATGNPISAMAAFFGNAESVYLTGEVKRAAFWVLVPIGYVLILSSALLYPCKWFKYFLHAACAVLIPFVAFLHMRGASFPMLELCSIGILGIVCGFISPETLSTLGRRLFPIIVAYLVYLIGVEIWGANYSLQILGVCVNLLLMYAIALRLGKESNVAEQVAHIGKYSLFGYVFQIAVLQFLARVLGSEFASGAKALTALLVTLVLTWLSIQVLDRLRAASKTVDSAYKLTFG